MVEFLILWKIVRKLERITREKRVFDDNLRNAYEVDIVEQNIRGIICKKRDKTVESMKKLEDT